MRGVPHSFAERPPNPGVWRAASQIAFSQATPCTRRSQHLSLWSVNSVWHMGSWLWARLCCVLQLMCCHPLEHAVTYVREEDISQVLPCAVVPSCHDIKIEKSQKNHLTSNMKNIYLTQAQGHISPEAHRATVCSKMKRECLISFTWVLSYCKSCAEENITACLVSGLTSKLSQTEYLGIVSCTFLFVCSVLEILSTHLHVKIQFWM